MPYRRRYEREAWVGSGSVIGGSSYADAAATPLNAINTSKIATPKRFISSSLLFAPTTRYVLGMGFEGETLRQRVQAAAHPNTERPLFEAFQEGMEMSIRIARDQAVVVALLILAQLGGGMSGRSPAQQIERSVTQPVPRAPATAVERSPNVWVPDRYFADPVQGGTSLVPGHWERRLESGNYYAPPTTACNLAGGCSTVPAGVRRPPDTRTTPFDTQMAP